MAEEREGGQGLGKLDRLESQSVFIIREAYRSFKNIGMLWSIGKDSTVLLWLAKKAFFTAGPARFGRTAAFGKARGGANKRFHAG
jgi:hypothetical protein